MIVVKAFVGADVEITMALPAALDLDAEIERLTRDEDKAERDFMTLDRRLSDPEFLSRAPADVVDDLRERRLEAVGRWRVRCTAATTLRHERHVREMARLDALIGRCNAEIAAHGASV